MPGSGSISTLDLVLIVNGKLEPEDVCAHQHARLLGQLLPLPTKVIISMSAIPTKASLRRKKTGDGLSIDSARTVEPRYLWPKVMVTKEGEHNIFHFLDAADEKDEGILTLLNSMKLPPY